MVANNTYFILTALLFLEISASWDVYGRGDVAALAAACIAVNIFNVYIVSSNNASSRTRKKWDRVHSEIIVQYLNVCEKN